MTVYMERVILLSLALLSAPVAAQSANDVAKDVGKTAGDIATDPLKDANIIKSKIPPELQSIMDKPYSLTGLKTCAQFSAEIGKLTKILGPDVDVTQPYKDQTATEVMLDGVQGTISGLIPGMSIVRIVSGADKQERRARAAVLAGGLRRAYLKGTARGKGCKI